MSDQKYMTSLSEYDIRRHFKGCDCSESRDFCCSKCPGGCGQDYYSKCMCKRVPDTTIFESHAGCMCSEWEIERNEPCDRCPCGCGLNSIFNHDGTFPTASSMQFDIPFDQRFIRPIGVVGECHYAGCVCDDLEKPCTYCPGGCNTDINDGQCGCDYDISQVMQDGGMQPHFSGCDCFSHYDAWLYNAPCNACPCGSKLLANACTLCHEIHKQY